MNDKDEEAALVRCDECGHRVPAMNMAVHCATCHGPPRRRDVRDDDHEEGVHDASANSATREDATTGAASMMELCETCGHRIPSMNMLIHRAACHKEEQAHSLRDHDHDIRQHRLEEIRNEVSNWKPSQLKEKLGDLGVNIRGMVEKGELVEAYARATMEVEEEERNGVSSAPSAVEVLELDDAIETVVENESHQDNNMAQNESQQDNNERRTDSTGGEQWACPRCTLLNPNHSNQCDACLYHHSHIPSPPSPNSSRLALQQQQQQPALNGGMQVQVSEMDPRVVGALGSATTVISWGLLGGLIGGPVGALAGGAMGATMDGMTRLNNHRLEQAGGHAPHSSGGPRFVFTTVSHSPTGEPSLSMTTSSNSPTGRRGIRTVRISGPNLDQLTLADRQILQMLLTNAMSQEDAANVNQMSYDELLERFGVGLEHRGSSPEAIARLPLTTMDTRQLQELTDNQKSCNICLEDFKEGDQARKLSCDHVFHQACIDRWLSQVASCPICKKVIDEPSCHAHGDLEARRL